jgi:glyoxalase/bleomycin resistance protein/dioxygenase superfamily protein
MTICRGPIIQTAWVTLDADSTERFLTDQIGAGGWTRIPDVHFGPDTCTYRGKPADFVAHVSLSYIGDMQLEVIQPVRGESIYTEFLRRAGGGLHHICFETADIAEVEVEAAAQGIPVVQRGIMAGGAMTFAYLDGSAAGVPYVELAQIGPDMESFFEHVKSQATR